MKSKYRFRQYGGERDFLNRFASVEEFRSILHRVDLTQDIPLNHGGAVLLSDTKEAYVDDGDYHTLVLGSTGSMKTRLFVFPTVFTLGLAGENMVIADPKGEIFQRTSGFLKEKGYDIHVLNLRDLDRSDSWNPLKEAYVLFNSGKQDEGLKVASDFISALIEPLNARTQDRFWPNAAKDFLFGLSEILLRGATDPAQINVSSLITFSSYCHSSSSSWDGLLLRRFCDKLPVHSSIREHIDTTVNNAPITMDCIMSFVSSALAPFLQSLSLQRLASNSTIDVHCFSEVERKHVIYIIVPDENRSFHFFVSSFIKQLYGAAVSDAYHLPGRQLHRRLNFILDEFANIPAIPDMPSMITAGRSRNIRFYLIVQSDNQLKENYKQKAETIKTNCLSWIFLASKESSLIEQVQAMAGTRERDIGSDPLISYFELTSLQKVFGEDGGAEAIALFSRSKAFKTFLPDISRYEQFAGFEPVELPYTQSHIEYFNVRARCGLLSRDDVERIYCDPIDIPDSQDRDRLRPEEEDE